MRRFIVLSAWGIAAAFTLILSSCGIITAPVSAPAAVLENANFNPTFRLIDPDGKPLSDVILEQHLSHHFWTPIAGGTETNENNTRAISDHVDINERGSEIVFTFKKAGFYDTKVWMRASDPKSLFTNYGKWPLTDSFPIVLSPRTPDAPLRLWQGVLTYNDYPASRVLELPRLWAAGTSTYVNPNTLRTSDYFDEYGALIRSQQGNTNVVINAPARTPSGWNGPGTYGQPVSLFAPGNVENPADMAPGTFYLTMTTPTPHPINARGELDPLEVNLPARIALHVAGGAVAGGGDAGGLVPLHPRTGYAPILMADEAPAAGYQPEIVIETPRLKEMRLAESDRILDAYEYFYIQSAGRFGKGYIAWSQRIDPKTKAPAPLAFRVAFWMQPTAGNRNLTWHDGLAK